MPFDVTYHFADGPGNTASGAQVSQNFTDLVNEVIVVNGALTSYQHVHRFVAQITSGAAAGTYILSTAAAIANGSITAADPSVTLFYIDPADWNVSGRTTKLRIRAGVGTNAVAPGVTFTVGLYPVSTLTGSSGAAPTLALGPVITGSQAAVATPGAGGGTWVLGADFNCPTAGAYALAVLTSGTTAVNALEYVWGFLQMRRV